MCRFGLHILFLLAAVLMPLTPPVLSAENQADGWRIDQTSKTYGQHEIVVCKFGVRLYCKKNDLTLIASPPYSEIVVFSNKTKRIFRTPLVQFRGIFDKAMALFRGNSSADIPVILSGPATICGVEGVQYIEPPGYAEKQKERERTHEVSNDIAINVKYTVSRKICNDPRQGDAIARYLGTPKVGAMPLQFKYLDTDKKPHPDLNTLSCVKAKLAQAEFKIPVGYAPANIGQAIFVDSTSDEALNMMMGGSKVK